MIIKIVAALVCILKTNPHQLINYTLQTFGIMKKGTNYCGCLFIKFKDATSRKQDPFNSQINKANTYIFSFCISFSIKSIQTVHLHFVNHFVRIFGHMVGLWHGINVAIFGWISCHLFMLSQINDNIQQQPRYYIIWHIFLGKWND